MTLPTYTAFHGPRRLITAPLLDTLAHLNRLISDLDPQLPLLIVNDHTGHIADFDQRGSVQDVLRRIAPATTPPPKPSAVRREIRLLPRHQDWLEAQPGGGDEALGRLIDEARQRDPGRESVLLAQTAAQHFMTAFAGDFPNYQAASSALFQGRGADFEVCTREWPEDIRAHALHLAAPAFGISALTFT